MPLSRRSLFGLAGTGLLGLGTARAQGSAPGTATPPGTPGGSTALGAQGAPPPPAPAGAQAAALGAGLDPRTDRAYGPADAHTTVMEFFSLTCTHCAAFAQEVLPQVETQFIDTGKIRYVLRPFPLNQVDLLAFQVALSLPAGRYLPFVKALLASQDRWAFARGVNSQEELAKMAGLAGMPRATFDAAVTDDGLKNAILAAQDAAAKKYSVDSTPTFVFNGKPQAGEVSFATFAKLAGVSA